MNLLPISIADFYEKVNAVKTYPKPVDSAIVSDKLLFAQIAAFGYNETGNNDLLMRQENEVPDVWVEKILSSMLRASQYRPGLAVMLASSKVGYHL